MENFERQRLLNYLEQADVEDLEKDSSMFNNYITKLISNTDKE